jgi:hypothetical protein
MKDKTIKQEIFGSLPEIKFDDAAIGVVKSHIMASFLNDGSCTIFFHVNKLYGSYDQSRLETWGQLSLHFTLIEQLETYLAENELVFVEKRNDSNMVNRVTITLH